jgi:hypothetical protein
VLIMVTAVQPHPGPGVLPFPDHGKARGAAIRAKLINIAARPARSGRDQITWRLPVDWPWADGWLALFHATNRHHRPAGPIGTDSESRADRQFICAQFPASHAKINSVPKNDQPIHAVDPGSESV